jgi:hypothetical protein
MSLNRKRCLLGKLTENSVLRLREGSFGNLVTVVRVSDAVRRARRYVRE